VLGQSRASMIAANVIKEVTSMAKMRMLSLLKNQTCDLDYYY
jgi:hypothetical protein